MRSGHLKYGKKPSDEFPLWSKGAPGARGKSPKDIPTLTPFFAPPTNATGAAVIICPGGTYGKLSAHEGIYYACWLNELGIMAFVLKYRLGTSGYHHPAMMQDVQRAIRYVRAKSSEWNLDPNRIGIIGSSAGGHLAATSLTLFDEGQKDAADSIDRVSSRPDLGILCYPVITLGSATHPESRKNLLGKDPDPSLIELLSAAALKQNGVPFTIHLYPSGPHGIGLGSRQWDPAHRHPWTIEAAKWLKEMRFAK